jgi:hypothetical protein
MDPYIERPELWPDFRNSLVVCLKGSLRPALRSRYAVRIEQRRYTTFSETPIRADRIIRPDGAPSAEDVDVPWIFEGREVIESQLLIVEPIAGNRIVTAIKVLGPDDKRPDEERQAYWDRRDELWSGGANLVEIDLWRAGEPTVRLTTEQRESLRPWHYVVVVSRRRPSRREAYGVPLTRRLPRIAVPLADDDADLVLDLQTAFTRVWDESPYPEMLRYEGPPPGPLTPGEIAWCEGILRAAGHRLPA